MKNKIGILFLSLGWILLLLFLGSGFVFNTFMGGEQSVLSPITWEEHLLVFDGALTCSLTSEELMERKKELKEKIFPKLQKKIALSDGYIYYFEDEPGLAENIMEFIGKEKQCCPFFKFDFSILPFKKGLAFQISGSPAVKEFLTDFEQDFDL